MVIDPMELVTGRVRLASLPEVVSRVCELIGDPRTSASDIGQVISEDPALTARLLRVVNSPFYGFPSSIDTVSRAVTVVGTAELMDLVLAASVVRMFRGIPPELVDMDSFWHHSLYCGVVARVLAARRRRRNIERHFVGGLIHDLGALVLYQSVPDLAARALALARERDLAIYLAEREVMGCDHAAVGAELMRTWNMPPVLEEVVAYHHEPQRAHEYPEEVAIVHLADVISGALETPDIGSEQIPPLEPAAWESAGFPVETLEAIVTDADRQFSVAHELIAPDHLEPA
ncbi:HDOD domain protein [bacterium BMS3Bbin12]|nr:HDOD domain protein [bacterium BMS3Abin12]GBE47515.1 HDOD domain protein [bacterium BMS3Bbin12]GBE50417.1 HDOD domain protein [bacterium BMS3Bbin13]HDJ86797.1 HDOD domain-containing protein [Chromatiales bacterium]